MEHIALGLTAAALWAVLAMPVHAQSSVSDKIRAALQQTYRSDANRARDRNRDPVTAMKFCRLKDEMKVIVFAPGRGWYTELLEPVLKDRSTLYISHTAKRLARLDDSLKLEALSRVRKLPIASARYPERGKIVYRSLDYGMTDDDLLLGIQEYHNIDHDSVSVFNRPPTPRSNPAATTASSIPHGATGCVWTQCWSSSKYRRPASASLISPRCFTGPMMNCATRSAAARSAAIPTASPCCSKSRAVEGFGAPLI